VRVLNSVEVMLRWTVIQPVCLGIRHPSGAHDQIFIAVSCEIVDAVRPL
jgi:hypothetical protein